MKYNFIDDYEYEDTQRSKRNTKIKEVPKLSRQEIETLAKTLITRNVDYKNILGYRSTDKKSKNPVIVKYDKEFEIFVVYDNKSDIIYSANYTWRQYNWNLYDPGFRFEYEDIL